MRSNATRKDHDESHNDSLKLVDSFLTPAKPKKTKARKNLKSPKDILSALETDEAKSDEDMFDDHDSDKENAPPPSASQGCSKSTEDQTSIGNRDMDSNENSKKSSDQIVSQQSSSSQECSSQNSKKSSDQIVSQQSSSSQEQCSSQNSGSVQKSSSQKIVKRNAIPLQILSSTMNNGSTSTPVVGEDLDQNEDLLDISDVVEVPKRSKKSSWKGTDKSKHWNKNDLLQDKVRKVQDRIEKKKYSTNPATVKRVYKEKIKTIKASLNDLQLIAGKPQNFCLCIWDNVHDPKSKPAAASAGKMLVFAKGELEQMFMNGSLKYDHQSCYVFENNINFDEKKIDPSMFSTGKAVVVEDPEDEDEDEDEYPDSGSSDDSDDGTTIHSKTANPKKDPRKEAKRKERKEKEKKSKEQSRSDITDALPAAKRKSKKKTKQNQKKQDSFLDD